MLSISFTSIEFLSIALITFLLYWFSEDRYKNLILILGCYAFYSLIGIKLACLLFLMTILTYTLGNKIIVMGDKNKKILLIIGILINIAVLAVFKYLDFFIINVADLFNALNIRLHLDVLNLVMPAGLSFYTFMLISHLIDCNRGLFFGNKIKMSAFMAYVCFFPHLIAGPIDRSRLIIPQLCGGKSFSFLLAREGIWQILNGLVKKIIVADTCAIAVNYVWRDVSSQSSLTLLIAAGLYSMEIYFDFSAFSDMAVGVGKLFGLRLMPNFNYPYFSRNISEFWRKWHMSLTSWFTEYVYIPLGGNRLGKIRTFINTLIVFGLCGFWHGAKWSYIVWGLICGAMFLPILIQKKPTKYKGQPSFCFVEIIKILVTFLFISFAWIIFRGAQADEWDTYNYFFRIFTADFEYQEIPYLFRGLIFSFVFMIFEWTQRKREFALLILDKFKRPVRWTVYISLTILIYAVYLTSPTVPSTDAFIYQNF